MSRELEGVASVVACDERGALTGEVLGPRYAVVRGGQAGAGPERLAEFPTDAWDSSVVMQDGDGQRRTREAAQAWARRYNAGGAQRERALRTARVRGRRYARRKVQRKESARWPGGGWRNSGLEAPGTGLRWRAAA